MPSELLPTVTISPERKAFLRNTGNERSMSRMVVAHCTGERGTLLVSLPPTSAYCPCGRNYAHPYCPGSKVIHSDAHRACQKHKWAKQHQRQEGCCPSPKTHARCHHLVLGTTKEGWGLGQTRECKPSVEEGSCLSSLNALPEGNVGLPCQASSFPERPEVWIFMRNLFILKFCISFLKNLAMQKT